MKCPSCGAEIDSKSNYCDFCGTQITVTMRREEEQLNKPGCPKCGSSNVGFSREKQGEVVDENGTRIVYSTIGLCKDCGFTWETASNAKTKNVEPQMNDTKTSNIAPEISNTESKTNDNDSKKSNVEPQTINIHSKRSNAEPQTNDSESVISDSNPKMGCFESIVCILLWIFVLPLPLTVLLIQKKKMNGFVKAFIIIMLWAAYTNVIKSAYYNIKIMGCQKEESATLQKIFLSIHNDMKSEDVDELISENELSYDVDKEATVEIYTLACRDSVAKMESDGDYIEIGFNADDGSFQHALYYDNQTDRSALLYYYGAFNEFHEEELNNEYSGYYYIDTYSDDDGITIEDSKGKSKKTDYFECENGEDAMKHVND